MGKGGASAEEQENAAMAEADGETSCFISPVANPLLEGKSLKKSLKLLKLVVESEREMRKAKAESGGEKKKAKSFKKPLKRGVVEVTKCIRKGEKGVVFLASDVYPIDITAHLPILCEENDVVYAYVGSKKTLGAACKSKRPTSVLMVSSQASGEEVSDLFQKTEGALRKNHPYF